VAQTLLLLTTVFLSVFLPFVAWSTTPEPPPPTQVKLTLVASGLSAVTNITHAGDSRLFVTEQDGRIRAVQGGQLLPTPFLDISARVACCGERGLLGLAFHPSYASNGYFYVNYTYLAANNALRTRVSRFKVSAGNPNVADANSEEVVLEFSQPYDNHNGGSLHFGPDGYLYIAVGDGGNAYDPPNNGQNTGVLLGKILRIDVNRTTGADCGIAPGRNYGIPAGNPFADGAGGACDEIWAYGLRNPWRISFDRGTGDLWIADVGQGAREEIDFQGAGSAGGQNYGWDCWEGTLKNTSNDPSPACAANPTTVAPIYDYDHNGGRCSITGGYVYRGAAYPGFKGTYFFADYCSAEMWALKRTTGSPAVTKLTISGATLSNPRSFGEDANGEIYVASPSAMYRIEAP
jgi:glucose/arabinose dehydrogenase